MANVEITNHYADVEKALQAAMDKAAMMCGMVAETAAKQSLTASGAVDTGYLRNSVTFGIGGKPPHISQYSGKGKKGKPARTGGYGGSLPADSDPDERTVYVGTNVEYAPEIEFGTSRMAARPFIRTAFSDNLGKVEAAVRKAFQST